MADIEFGLNDAEAFAVIKSFVRQINGDFYGKDGVMAEFSALTNYLKGEKEEREREHKENRARLNAGLAILSAIALYLALFVHPH